MRRATAPVLATAVFAAGLLATAPAAATPGGPDAAPAIDPVGVSAASAAL